MESERASTFSAIVRRLRGNESACGEMCKRNTESRREKKLHMKTVVAGATMQIEIIFFFSKVYHNVTE